MDNTVLVCQASAHPDTPYVGAGVSAVLGGVMGARAAKSGAVGYIFSRQYLKEKPLKLVFMRW